MTPSSASTLYSLRVLHVDAENPEDVVRYRLKRLGLDGKGAGNLRYLKN